MRLLEHKTRLGTLEVPTWALVGVGGLVLLAGGREVVKRVSKPTAPKPQQGVDVLIDPGHGGTDPGAVAPDKTTERDQVMACALTLKALLERQGLRVALTRTNSTDAEPSFPARTASRGAKLYVSLHMDCATCHGWWVFFGGQSGSQTLAQGVAAQLAKSPMVDKPFKVVSHTTSRFGRLYIADFTGGPAILVELGRVRPLNDTQRQQLMQLVASGIAGQLA